MKLTNTAILNAKAKEKDYKIADGDGMYLLITKSGGKLWKLKYRFDGKEKKLSLGAFPEVSLKEARERRSNARKLIADNQDPSAVKQEEKQQAIINLENSFESIAKKWFDNNITRWEEENATRTWRRLENNIFPTLGKKPINEIKPYEILAAIRVMEQRGATYLSRKTLQTCSAVFRYARAEGKWNVEYNPTADLSDALKPHEAMKHPSIKAKQLPEFYKKLDEVIAMPTNKLAIRLLLLTFLRQGELRQCKWEYIDFEAKELRVPAEIMKMKESHIVPLAPQAISVLQEIHKTNGWSPYIFPSQSRRVHPYISENTINKIIHTMGYKGQMVAHGARSLASTILNGHHFKPDVIERQLAHSDKDKIRGVYNRAEYLPERHAMMEWWGSYLEQAENGKDNVIEAKFGISK
jgi:integrase